MTEQLSVDERRRELLNWSQTGAGELVMLSAVDGLIAAVRAETLASCAQCGHEMAAHVRTGDKGEPQCGFCDGAAAGHWPVRYDVLGQSLTDQFEEDCHICGRSYTYHSERWGTAHGAASMPLSWHPFRTATDGVRQEHSWDAARERETNERAEAAEARAARLTGALIAWHKAHQAWGRAYERRYGMPHDEWRAAQKQVEATEGALLSIAAALAAEGEGDA